LAEDKTLKKLKKALLILIIAAPLYLLWLPSSYFDTGESLCLSVSLFNFECIGCGITRGIMHLLHFEFSTAWSYNKLTYLVFPFLVMFWFYLIGKLINRKIFSFFDGFI